MSIDERIPTDVLEPVDTTVRDVNVAIVGTGFSGLGMAIRLLHDGEADFLVFERADSIGGTWRDNSYPGCACDVVANLYSFDFAPNKRWKSNFGTRDELVSYLSECSARFGVDPYIRFDHEVRSAHWDEVVQRWRIETSQGTYTARVFISAMGYLSDPNIPDLPGLATFQGPTFHSSRWNHDVDLEGKRVAVIGTGASAIQFVPAIQPIVGRLDLYQRTPPWVAHKPEKANTGVGGWMLRHLPGYQRFRRNFNKWGREILIVFMSHPKLMGKVQKMASDHLERHVTDPVLREKLRPDYVIGCKRMLFSNTYYQAITRPSVDVITSGIREVRADAIVTEDGTVHPADVIVFGTGFRATNRPAAQRIWGRDGQRLADAWRDGMSAYLGTAVSGFPNLFLLLGPNTALGHSSMTLMSEAQINYVGDFVRKLRRQHLGSVDVKVEVQQSFVDRVQGYARKTVWNTGGCSSWYLDANGNNTTMWPTFTWRFRKMTRVFELDDYEVRPRVEVTAGADTTSKT
jgi:cation diffusion facilitator CzcD-associated flavoprotein CzcO